MAAEADGRAAHADRGIGSLAITSLLEGTVTDEPGRVLQHVLLSTDGTVVPLLEGCFGEPIRLAGHVQSLRDATPTDPAELELDEGDSILHRKVLLQGEHTGRQYAFAESVLVPHRLPPLVRKALLSTSTPIGRVLNEHRVESFREVLRVGRTRTGRNGEEVLFRTYRILSGGRPVMLITEYFPPFSLPDSVTVRLPELAQPAWSSGNDQVLAPARGG